MAELLQDKAKRAEVCWRRCDLALRTGDFAQSETSAREAMALATQAGDERLGLNARKRLADALNMLGQVDAGKALAEEGLAMDRADLASAQALVHELLPVLAVSGALEGCDCPRLVWLACCEVLRQADDPRAADLLRQAHAELLAEAQAIADPALRHSFLTAIPEHQQIVTEAAVLG